MTNVVGFPPRRKGSGAYVSGPARCIGCRHDWVAVAPAGATELECPNCGAEKGIWMLLIAQHDEEHFGCPCGNQFLHIIRSGAYCPNCGLAWPWSEIL